MNLQKRIALMGQLGHYLRQSPDDWKQVCLKASQKNQWFTPEFIELSARSITEEFLNEEKLSLWTRDYQIPAETNRKIIGIVMAGNIPMVGFHDFLCVFMSGHQQLVKLSTKDDTLLSCLFEKLYEWEPACKELFNKADNLKGCDAYIATGNDQSAAHFEQYFGKFPHIIRKNRTSVAILDGSESRQDLENLSNDIHFYFGLGCRNVTRILVPKGYDFVPLLDAFHRFKYLRDNVKYSHNYDFRLSLSLLNKQYYMTNGTTLLVEESSNFSPISVLHYSYYSSPEAVIQPLLDSEEIQCIVGKHFTPFGTAQSPVLSQYADGVDTMKFLCDL